MPVDARADALAALAGAGDNPFMRSFPQGAVFTWDHDLRYLSSGGQGLADVGLSREMLEGRTIFEVFPAETASAIEPLYRAALRGESTTIDVPYAGRVYSQRLSPVLDRDGSIVAGMGFTQDVTGVRAAETALREAEERARLGFENAPIGQALVELDGRWRQVNSALTRLIGYTESELFGMTFQDITHPDDLDADLAQVEQLVAGTIDSYQMEKRYFTATGATVWVLLAASLVRSADDSPLYFISQIQDITERKHTEQALRAGEEKLRLLVDSTPDYAIFMLDPDGLIASWNAGAQRLKGFTEADVLGQHFSILYPEERRAAGHPQRELEIARAEGRHEEEGWRVRKDGSVFWADVVITAAYGEDGELRGFSKVVRDRSEHKKSEAKFEGLLEAAPDAMLGVDADGLIQLANTQAERLFGYPRAELLGRPIAILVPDGVRDADLHHGRGDPTDPQVRSMGTGIELSARRKDGSEFPSEISLSSIEGEDGLLVMAAVRDVTERRAFEVEVARARDVAENAASSRQGFLANMSHEIRTPMNAVIGMTSLLLDTALDSRQRDYVETVRTSGEHLLTIINDILDYAKIDAGKMVLEELPFGVRNWLQDTLDLITAQAHEKGLEVVCDVAPEVPAAIVGDPSRLRQILVNLLSNAVKFTARGEIVVTVTVDAADTDRIWLRVVVADTGIGLAMDRVERLFDPFTQADSTTTRLHGGTGLGLAISRNLALSMGGSITVDSTLGAGTAVTLTFPAATSDVVEPTATAGLAGHRILVVDDNATNRRILQSWALNHQMGYESAEDAAHALRVLESDQNFSFAIIDHTMPGMDGVELGALLKTRVPAARLILLSSAPDACETAGRGVFDAVMSKPAKQERLFDLMATLLSTGQVPDQRTRPPLSVFDLSQEPGHLAILVVDDSAVNQKVAQLLLARFGFRAEVVASGSEAVAALEHRDYDLVLMDVQMPEMDGLEATRLIRARWPARPLQIVAMTANVAPENIRACREAGMDSFLGKPILVEPLAKMLRVSLTALPPAPQARPLLDASAVDRLCAQIGVDAVRQVAGMFLAALEEGFPVLFDGCRDRDRELLARTAHRLKGSAGNLGVQNLTDLLDELEHEVVAADWPQLEGLVTRIQAQGGPTRDRLLAQLD
ncbi:PAS domain S-box protein [Sporichthya sp.]|uniref:PAS domain-containing hybrid sensor histidine kinase/response regulator n=1 Tax=Sporichthya sp. TaxID=65475 RepID=UPI0017BE5355|nr:PAS domain S-box protein [Sporichthya sp.]MBA3742204.1 PAS domain S-box protein [Sporichthya sp.]